MFRRAVLIAIAALSIVLVPVSPASADHGDWHQSGCQGNVWWIETTVYDPSTGLYWPGSYDWWIDYGIYGHSVYSTYGPIHVVRGGARHRSGDGGASCAQVLVYDLPDGTSVSPSGCAQ